LDAKLDEEERRWPQMRPNVYLAYLDMEKDGNVMLKQHLPEKEWNKMLPGAKQAKEDPKGIAAMEVDAENKTEPEKKQEPPKPLIDVTKRYSHNLDPYFPNLYTVNMPTEDKEGYQKKRVDGITGRYVGLGEGGLDHLSTWAPAVIGASLRKPSKEYTKIFHDILKEHINREEQISNYIEDAKNTKTKHLLLGKGAWGIRYTNFLQKVFARLRFGC
jgi:hypothetical protein